MLDKSTKPKDAAASRGSSPSPNTGKCVVKAIKIGKPTRTTKDEIFVNFKK